MSLMSSNKPQSQSQREGQSLSGRATQHQHRQDRPGDIHHPQPSPTPPHRLPARQFSDPLARRLPVGLWFCVQASMTPVFTHTYGLFDAAGCILAVVALRRWGRGWRDKRVK
ncbi:hypothetical protein N657DRAFT_698479 [Parathielavia appendiculata]|uniref:Uncharacterized protein n=1 Tax=Parathielavia appendiculata TaxID=2587402 RepID=A0AAN6Z1C0_9PEZI|nr:hypothetical protein N657DRAFT_698479 [Parathielavia appendiculata]